MVTFTVFVMVVDRLLVSVTVVDRVYVPAVLMDFRFHVYLIDPVVPGFKLVDTTLPLRDTVIWLMATLSVPLAVTATVLWAMETVDPVAGDSVAVGGVVSAGAVTGAVGVVACAMFE